jgi:EAL domain-containing protein (putative c-di-GMP-specific phosphodiesterase class I)
VTREEPSADQLHAEAEAALYDAKRRAGQSAIVAFSDLGTPGMISTSKADALRALLAERAIDIAFQPIWDRLSHRLLGFEALARPSSRLGFDGPQEAFDVADALHLTEELDALCRESALARAHEVPADALLFLNVSPLTLERRLLPGTSLADLARSSGIDPKRIVLEITERSRARTGPVIDEAIRLRELGFRLALDDTGAGNAGLEMLSRMTVDFVKIDGEVIAKITNQRTARGVFAGIVAIARETGAYLIAEGIEDARTLASVASLRAPFEAGVGGLQGYLIGRPTIALPQNGGLARYEAAIGKRVSASSFPRAVERMA